MYTKDYRVNKGTKEERIDRGKECKGKGKGRKEVRK